MNIYDLEKQATPRPWGHVSGVVTCADDGEHIGSFHTNTLINSTPSRHRMNGPASAILAAHCRNHFMEALEVLKHDVDPRWADHSDECEANPTDEELETSTEPHEERCDCWVSKRRDLIAKLENVE